MDSTPETESTEQGGLKDKDHVMQCIDVRDWNAGNP